MEDIIKFDDYIDNDIMNRAIEIIGKPINIKNAIQEISDYIENNINNTSIVKEIDELTEIKRKLKKI